MRGAASVVEARVLAASHALSFPAEQAWSEATMAALLAMPGTFACVDAGGAFVLARVAADEAEILTLAVPPMLRRRGHGRALVLSAIRRASEAGAVAIFLEVSRANVPAQALYSRLEFRRIGVRRRYYADASDALVLRKKIRPAAAAGA